MDTGISYKTETGAEGVYVLPLLPAGRGRKFLDRGGVLNAVIGGWTLRGITSVQSGMPLEMTTVTNLTGSLGGRSRPNRLRNGALSGDPNTTIGVPGVGTIASGNAGRVIQVALKLLY